MKIGFYYAEDFSEGGGVHKQINDTYEFDDATDTIEFTQTETDYALATDRAVTISGHDGVTFVPGGSDEGK